MVEGLRLEASPAEILGHILQMSAIDIVHDPVRHVDKLACESIVFPLAAAVGFILPFILLHDRQFLSACLSQGKHRVGESHPVKLMEIHHYCPH